MVGNWETIQSPSSDFKDRFRIARHPGVTVIDSHKPTWTFGQSAKPWLREWNGEN
jgi:hypothetical protein